MLEKLRKEREEVSLQRMSCKISKKALLRKERKEVILQGMSCKISKKLY